jgi:RsiW-degrading membrane proteinase PrsW (M82 family)
MEIIQLIIASIILGILYKKMLNWGTSEKIARKQAFILIIFGVIATFLTLFFALGIGYSISKMGYTLADIQNLTIRAFASAFLLAGLTEEVSKLLMILLAIKLVHPQNVYEYSLIGAGIGMGFTLHEELLYGGSIVGFSRFLTLTFHMVLGVVMGKYIGMGIYNKNRGMPYMHKYFTALIFPITIHTIYDALTVHNPAVTIEGLNDEVIVMWVVAALVCITGATIGQFIFFKKLKKQAEIYAAYNI